MKTITALFGICIATHAAVIQPVSYDMPNGETGTYNYWDETYNGTGNNTTDGVPLNGGLGDLTDGIVAGDNWFVTEAPAGPGPYVGWRVDPLITFRFAAVNSFTTVRIHLDDSDGNGGVSAPQSVSINGTQFLIAEPAGTAPFWAELDISGLTTDTLQISLQRKNVWVFASEFEFQNGVSAVPEPSTFLIAGAGLGLLFVRFGVERRTTRAPRLNLVAIIGLRATCDSLRSS